MSERKVDSGILFDLDGTLLDSIEGIGAAMNEVLGIFGFPPLSSDRYRRMVGYGMRELVRAAMSDGKTERDVEDIDRAFELMKERYEESWKKGTRPFAGIPALLDDLSGRHALAVFSNKPDLFTRAMVFHFFPGISFCKVVGQREGQRPKPYPDGALYIARACGIEPKRWLYVGDGETDMATAVSAGMIPVAVLWGFREKEELTEAGATYFVEKPTDILALATMLLPVSPSG